MHEGARIDAIITDIPRACDLLPHDRPLTKTETSGVDSRVVVWFREILLGRLRRVQVGGLL
jgi:hypothetical protein